jgi:rhodanese-related sulfurtransferase
MLIVLALISGGMLLWPLVTGRGGAAGLTPAGAVQLINRERALVLDVREPDEFAAGHISGSRNVPLGQLQDKLPGAAKNRTVPLLLTCATGVRAQRALGVAQKLGYEKAHVMTGGLKAWKEANLPTGKN